MNIQTVQFAHILEDRDLEVLHDFLSQTAFVISHKSESVDTILKVLWYIPVSSTIIIVTNCSEEERPKLASALKSRLADHRKTYLIHQKDEGIASLLKNAGVPQILGIDGKVLNGKGEGMYIGALCAHLLGNLRWLIFYDADNFVPSALLEYTLAMCRLFMAASQPARSRRYGVSTAQSSLGSATLPELHNVRICWSSKPDVDKQNWGTRILGRTTRVVSPLFDSLLRSLFGIYDQTINSSNAGEQGMTVKTATSLRFSSGFSVETFLLLDLFFHATTWRGNPEKIIFQQYLSQSPHFHEKKGDEHIKKMIEESLGCFSHFEAVLPRTVKTQLQRVYDTLQLEQVTPVVYPPLQALPLERYESLMQQYALFTEADRQDQLAAEVQYQAALPTRSSLHGLAIASPSYQEALPVERNLQDLVVAGTTCQDMLLTEPNLQDILAAETGCQNLLLPDTGYQNFLLAD